jgi:hypothetical protein
MTERDEQGRFVEQGPDEGFDEEEAKRNGDEYGSHAAWQKHRQEIIEKYGKNE